MFKNGLRHDVDGAEVDAANDAAAGRRHQGPSRPVLQAAQIAQEDVAPLGGLARYNASLKQICAATRVARWFIFYQKS
jgi:hypothetical protein